MTRSALVIDDHSASRAFLVKALGQLGFDVVGESDNGAAAVELAAAVAPDVILMAVGLRGVDGIKVAQTIMETKPLTEKRFGVFLYQPGFLHWALLSEESGLGLRLTSRLRGGAQTIKDQ